jgi:hypothetical protein
VGDPHASGSRASAYARGLTGGVGVTEATPCSRAAEGRGAHRVTILTPSRSPPALAQSPEANTRRPLACRPP